MPYLLECIFTGFGIYSILFSFFPKKKTELDENVILFDQTACITFSINGLFFFLFSICVHNVETTHMYLIIPTVYLIITQITWYKKVRKTKFIRAFIGLCMLFSFEKYVIIITSLHRDYLPAWHNYYFSTTLISYNIYFLVFLSITFPLFFARKYLLQKMSH